MHANLSKVGWAVLVGRLHLNVSARDIRSLGGSDAVSSFPLHSVHWPGSSSGNCHPEGFTEDAGVPCPHPAPSPHRAPRCPWCKIQSARYGPEGSASVLLPPSSPPSLPVTHSTPATWASSLFWNPPATIQPQGLCTCCSLSTDPSSSSCSP